MLETPRWTGIWTIGPGEWTGSRERAITESAPGGGIDRERFLPVPQRQSRLTGWLVTLGVSALAAGMRLWDLGSPNRMISDENYYATFAWSQIHRGYVTGPSDLAHILLNEGVLHPIASDAPPGFSVHPPTGTWLIGAGEAWVSPTPFGWRIPSVIAGTLIVLVVIRLLRRLTGSMFLAGAGGLLLTFDGLEFTMSRLAMLDIFLTLFILVGVLALVADRQWSRRRLLARHDAGHAHPQWGPLLWWRPWRLVAGLAFGLAVSTKWSALFVIAAFGLLVVWWDASGRRGLGVRGALWRSVLVDGVPAFGYLVVVAFGVYLASWLPWMFHAVEIAPSLADPYNGGPFWGAWVNVPPHGLYEQVVYAFRALWHYHQDVYRFHTVTLAGVHDLEASSAWGWPLLDRPFIFLFHKGIAVGTEGCTGAAGTTCMQGMIGLGTPVLWWIGALGVVDAIYLMLAKRDWRLAVPLLGLAVTWLPWLMYGDRPIYAYYAVAIIPFTVIALVLVLARFALPAVGAPGESRRITPGRVFVVVLVVAVAANFAWEWPVLTGQTLSTEQYAQRVFLPNWRLGWHDTTTTSPGGLDAVLSPSGSSGGTTGSTSATN